MKKPSAKESLTIAVAATSASDLPPPDSTDGKQTSSGCTSSFVSFFKEKTPRDKKYLLWLKGLPCVCCGRLPPNEPHHCTTGGKSIKGSDYDALPLCASCHRDCHQYGRNTFWEKHQKDMHVLIEAHNIVWRRKHETNSRKQ